MLEIATVTLIASVAFYIVFKYLTKPWNIVRDFSKFESPTALKNDSQPPLYPNTWIPVVESALIKGSLVKNFTVCGEEVAIFRGKDGKAHAVDAFCPHMGANFGTGGTVVEHLNESCIQCPFHGWKFRASDGLCTNVPYAQDQKPPRGVGVKKWPCLEQNGFIHVWYHAEGSGPHWTPPVIPAISSEEYVYRGRIEHLFQTHAQEISRNVADYAHVVHLHGPSALLGADLRTVYSWPSFDKIMRHTSNAKWCACDAPESHNAKIFIPSGLDLFGVPVAEFNVELTQVGPAIVHMDIQAWGMRLFVVHSLTPVAPNQLKMIHHLYTPKGLRGYLLALFFFPITRVTLDRDVSIWQSKSFCKNPKLVKEEKALVEFTRWHEQFYSKNSVRYSQTKQEMRTNNLDW